MKLRPPRLALWLLLLAGACSSNLITSSSTGTVRRPTSAGAASGGASGGAGTSSTGTTTGSGTTSGATSGTTGQSCGAQFVENFYDGGYLPTECSAGQGEIKGRIVDYYTGAPIDIQFSVSDANNPLVQGNTLEGCGIFYFCGTPGTALTPLFDVTNYVPMEVNTVQFEVPDGIGITGRSGLGLFKIGDLMAVQQQNFTPMVDLTKSEIYVHVNPGTGACSATTGWVFQLQDLDGGLVDAGALYLNALTFENAPSTLSEETLLYDIDPAVRAVTLALIPPSGAIDGGSPCANQSDAYPYQATGVAPVAVGAVTFTVYVMP